MVELHEPVSERIGKILRENREAQGLTRQQLSEKSTVSDRQISAIELGEKGPSMNSLELLLRSLGLSADQIFYPELTEKDPMLTQITHLAASCTEQQKRMVVRFMEPKKLICRRSCSYSHPLSALLAGAFVSEIFF